MNVREAAFLSLERCRSGEKFANLELDSAIKKYGLEGTDRGFFTVLVYGVIERRITLDHMIAAFSSIPICKLESRVLTLMRLGAYQIMFLSRTPDSAAVNESVELAKKYTNKGTAGFVNGVLRSIVRNKEALPYPDRESDLIGHLSVTYSIPRWLCEMWVVDHGEEKAEKMLAAVNINPPITLRVNTLKTTRSALIETLALSGIEARPTELSEDGVRLAGNVPVSDLEAMKNGLCFVQDEASQLCVKALGAMRGETVIDTCCCPGGKSFGIAMDMENEGRLVSLDLHESKLSLVRGGAERLGITVLEGAVHNGTTAKPELVGTADRVLTDAPCSGLGVIAKKPDLRYKSPEDIARLPDLQYRILCSSAEYLKDGGTLVYSTCTVNKRENEEVVQRFLSSHPEFVPTGEGMPFGGPSVTLFPDEHHTDGFFIAKMVKRP